MRKILFVYLVLAAALLLARVHAEDDSETTHEPAENTEEQAPERVPEPRVNAVLQNTQQTEATTTTSHLHSNHSHHHHHHHHHNATSPSPRQKATTCLPRSISARVRDLLVEETTVVVLFSYRQNATLPSDVTFESYLVDCLRYTKLEVRINGQSFKNFTIMPGAILTVNQVTAVDDLPYLSTFEARLSVAQNRAGEDEYLTDERAAKTCYSAPGPVVNLRRSTLSNGSLWIEWDAPRETNAPSVCFYQIVVKDLNTNNETKHNQNERTFIIPKESLKSQYRITVFAFNSNTCYVNQFPFVDECRKKDIGSVGQFIDYRPPSMTTTRKPSGADQLKYSTPILLLAPILASRLFK